MSASRLPEDLVIREVEAICSRYKIRPSEARDVIAECFGKKPDLLARIEQEQARQDVTRWKAYRSTIKEVRKRVYYRLRRYHADRDEEARLREELRDHVRTGSGGEMRRVVEALVSQHVSTRERADHLTEFHETIRAGIGQPESILDVGCGYHPLTFPYDISLKQYVALERDAGTCETLEVFAPATLPTQLVTVCGSFTDVELRDLLPEGGDHFDAVFLFKLVPVIARSNPDALSVLAALPVTTFVVTASAEAMTRSHDVSRREDRLLRGFIEQTGRTEVDRFAVGNEFGYFVR